MILCAIPDNRHILSWQDKTDGILVLDDGALALWNATLPQLTIVDVERLVDRVAPVEVDEANHVKVLIKLLKSLLEPRNLGRLTCGISDLTQDLIPLEAVFLNVSIMARRVDVTAELVLGMVVIDTPELCIDDLIESSQHHCQ